ncbi:MAG: hypothetical protein ACKOW8_00770, partial [Flavobacteriales bacterium]
YISTRNARIDAETYQRKSAGCEGVISRISRGLTQKKISGNLRYVRESFFSRFTQINAEKGTADNTPRCSVRYFSHPIPPTNHFLEPHHLVIPVYAKAHFRWFHLALQ